MRTSIQHEVDNLDSKIRVMMMNEGNPDDAFSDFIGCIPYDENTHNSATNELLAEDISFSIIYSSFQDEIVCFLLRLKRKHVSLIERTNSIPNSSFFTAFFPVPPILKADSSLIAIVHQGRQQSANRAKQTSEFQKRSHPILHDIVAQKPMELTVVFHEDSSRTDQARSITRWIDMLSPTGVSDQFQKDTHTVWSDFMFTSSRYARKRPGSDAQTRRLLVEHFNSWDDRKKAIDELMRDGKLGTHCGWNSLTQSISDAYETSPSLHRHSANQWSIRLSRETMQEVRAPFHRDTYMKLFKDQENTDGSGWSTSYQGSGQSLCLSYLTLLMLHDPNVAKIGLSRPLRLVNDKARGVIQSGLVGNEPYSNAHLTGAGVIAAMVDTGVDIHHCMFIDIQNGRVPPTSIKQKSFDLKYRKVIQYLDYSGSQNDEISGHGTHVAGTLVGSIIPSDSYSMSDNKYHGMAPDAKLSVFDIGVAVSGDLSVPDDLGADMFPPLHFSGARVYSNSWGGSYWYDGYAIQLDQFLSKYPDSAVFFAAGNEGYTGKGTILSPGVSKNVIAVAAVADSDNSNRRADFSAIGPSPDGRQKPDIAAPGIDIHSADGFGEDSPSHSESCGIAGKSGTSMATPVGAGNAILIKQYFEDSNFWPKYCNNSYFYCVNAAGLNISGYQIKALVIHSGANDAYSYELGFGRMLLTNILPLSRYPDSTYSLYIDDAELESFQQLSYRAVALGARRGLVVSLAWYDPPNAVFASKSLLHDLDLVVTSPSGVVFFGNQILKDNKSIRDEYNNVERVKIVASAIELGAYSVSVQSKLLTETITQKFAIVISLDGYTEERDRSNNALTLSPDQFQECSSSPPSTRNVTVVHRDDSSRLIVSEPMMLNDKASQLHITMFNRVVGMPNSIGKQNGWLGTDSYTITPLGNHASESIIQGTFSDNSHDILTSIKNDALCVKSACYMVELNIDSDSHPGTQLDIPQCNIFLGALARSEVFCISNIQYDGAPLALIADPVTGLLDYNNLDLNPQKTFDAKGLMTSSFQSVCSSTCFNMDHVQFDLELYEGDGEGWYGAYFVIHESLPDGSFSSVFAGNLVEDFGEYVTVCLPSRTVSPTILSSSAILSKGIEKATTNEGAKIASDTYIGTSSSSQCYFLRLYTPDNYLDAHFPQMTFRKLERSCDLLIQDNVTVAKFCFDSTMTASTKVSTVQVEFFVPLSSSSVGMKVPTQPNAMASEFASSNLVSVGHCSMLVKSVVTSTSPETTSPVTTPLLAPTMKPNPKPYSAPIDLTSPPVNQPAEQVYDNQLFSSKCFSSCPGYPGVISDSNLCMFFLSTVYYQCSTFDVSMGLCARIDCASACDVATYCYYAAATVSKCHYNNVIHTTAMSAADADSDILKQCVLHYDSPSNSNDPGGDGSVVPNSKGLENIFMIGGK